MENDECSSTFTVDDKLILRCSKHLRGNPFRAEEYKHSAEWTGLVWTWVTREDDQHGSTA